MGAFGPISSLQLECNAHPGVNSTASDDPAGYSASPVVDERLKESGVGLFHAFAGVGLTGYLQHNIAQSDLGTGALVER